jgi:YHS domain-containing protein
MSSFVSNRRNFLAVAGASALVVSVPTVAAAKSPVYTSWGKAIKGYDPVAYFKAGKPVKGSSKFTHKWKGATWHFSSAGNRDLFAASPSSYAPQYGGYCAYAVSQGSTASITASAWDIVNGKLYLNYSKGIQSKWKKKRSAYISAANKNWPRVLN